MTALQQHIQEIELYGFTLLSSVLDADQVSAIKAALIRCEQRFGTAHTHRVTTVSRVVVNGPVRCETWPVQCIPVTRNRAPHQVHLRCCRCALRCVSPR